MKKPLLSNAERARQTTRAARAPLTLEAAAAQLADLGVTKDGLKALHKGGKVKFYSFGARRLVQQDELARLRVYLAEKLADDPEWLGPFCQRVRGVGGAARRVVLKAPPSVSMKVARIGNAPKPLPPRVVEQGRR